MNQHGPAALVNLGEIGEMELFILKRMKETTLGDHRSIIHGAGFNFVGVRDWAPGDPLSAIDWPQSSLTNFSPTVAREFEQDSTATIIAVADASTSTWCGRQNTPLAALIARCVAALGLTAVLFQDRFGLLTFGDRLELRTAVRPRVGKPHVLYCLDRYQQFEESSLARGADIISSLAGYLRKTSLVPVVSDFLFTDAPRLIEELSALNAVHDVLLILIDAQYAYRLGGVSAGWVETFDVETGARQLLSKRQVADLDGRVREWQDRVIGLARAADLDIVRVGLDRWAAESTLALFVAERRLRKS